VIEERYKNMMGQLSIKPSETAYICFLAGIYDSSIDKMISLVNEKRQQGFVRIVIMLSSGGGDVDAGVRGYTFLSALQDVEVVTHNIGLVASAAVSLYCGGHIRLSTPYSYFLIHEVYRLNNKKGLNEKYIIELYEKLEDARRKSAIIVSKITKRSVEQVEKDMKEAQALDSYYSKTWGLTHEVVDKLMEIGQEVIFIED
jgi:ATP-dependent protease ClpP protease subunit